VSTPTAATACGSSRRLAGSLLAVYCKVGCSSLYFCPVATIQLGLDALLLLLRRLCNRAPPGMCVDMLPCLLYLCCYCCFTGHQLYPCITCFLIAGQIARQALLDAIAGQPVKCAVQTTDKYDRKVAICYSNSGSGSDLGRTLVAKGVAVAYRWVRHTRRWLLVCGCCRACACNCQPGMACHVCSKWMRSATAAVFHVTVQN
jgi:hypothetical protein